MKMKKEEDKEDRGYDEKAEYEEDRGYDAFQTVDA